MSEGTPPTPHTPAHSLNPMTTLTHVQEDNAFEALTDAELESVDGGIAPAIVAAGGAFAALIEIMIKETTRKW